MPNCPEGHEDTKLIYTDTLKDWKGRDMDTACYWCYSCRANFFVNY